MSLSEPVLYDHSKHSHLLPQFCRIHIACILHDHILVTFLPPFSSTSEESPDPRVLKYWDRKAKDVEEGSGFIVMQLAKRDDGHDELAGYVMLSMPETETGPFRAEVEKLLVDPGHRRKGIAKLLMERLELEAKARGRTCLMLDTLKGSPAEQIYPGLGYTKIGEVPAYGISPKDGHLTDEIFFYKHL